MGQRLVVTIKDTSLEKPDLMKIYYHWSGYTKSTQHVLYELVDVIRTAELQKKSREELLLDIIKHVETKDVEEYEHFKKLFPNFDGTCAGGIDGGPNKTEWDVDTKKYKVVGHNPEWEYITKLYPNHKFNEHPDRNNGLIAMTEKGMEDMQNWSEGDASINLNTGECFNDTVFPHDYCDWKDAYDDEKEAQDLFDTAFVADSNPFEFNYTSEEDLNRSKLVFEAYCNSGKYIFRDDKAKMIYETIE